jgi:hypothetical protein
MPTRPLLAPSALRGLASTIDLPAHECDGLLIDRGGIPCLDGCKVRFSGLVARAGAPAMGLQQICRRTKRVGSSVKIAGAVGQDVLGHELGLAYLTVHGSARAGRQHATIDQLQCRVELLGKELGTAAVVGAAIDDSMFWLPRWLPKPVSIPQIAISGPGGTP